MDIGNTDEASGGAKSLVVNSITKSDTPTFPGPSALQLPGRQKTMKSIKEMQAIKAGRRWVQTGTHNAVKFSKGRAERETHKIAKALICANLSRVGLDYYTECTLKGGGRADIYIPSLELAVEVLDSETKSEFVKKAYPVRILPVEAEEIDLLTAHYLADGLVHDPDGTIQDAIETNLNRLAVDSE